MVTGQSFAIHVLVSGFTQGYGRWHGILELAERMRLAGHCYGVDSRVLYYTWRENWRHVAEYCFALTEQFQVHPLICIYAYSWGGGYAAPRFARQLQRRNLPVRAMVLSDPIFWHPVWPLRWRALTNWNWPLLGQPIIRIPHNVREVWTFQQAVTRPSGHRIIADNGCEIHPRVQLMMDHQHMDSAWEFHERCLAVANQIRDEAGLPPGNCATCPLRKEHDHRC